MIHNPARGPSVSMGERIPLLCAVKSLRRESSCVHRTTFCVLRICISLACCPFWPASLKINNQHRWAWSDPQGGSPRGGWEGGGQNRIWENIIFGPFATKLFSRLKGLHKRSKRVSGNLCLMGPPPGGLRGSRGVNPLPTPYLCL